MAKNSLYIIVAIVVIIIVVAGVLVYVFSQPGGGGGGGTHIDVYAGDSPAYGFGTSASSVTSNPGQTITLTAGQTYTVTLHNIGTMPHNWAIVNTKADGATDISFSGAQIGSASNPIQAGATGQATFTAGNAGSYYYICQVDSHVGLGMWGTVTVNP